MPNDPETLSVNVAEEVKIKDIPPGGGVPSEEPKEWDNTPEITEEEFNAQKEKFMAEFVRLSGRYVAPHTKKSRIVTAVDIERVIRDGKDMAIMCRMPHGPYNGGAALAHSQIESEDPLKFFVTADGQIIINPKIINHTKASVFEEEGCLSYPDKPPKKMVARFYKITVEYQTLIQKGEAEPRLSDVLTDEIKGIGARIFQHETAHLLGKDIYDENYSPNDCLETLIETK